MTDLRTDPYLSASPPATTDALTDWVRRAGASLREHRFELLVLAGTIGFVLVVTALAVSTLSA